MCELAACTADRRARASLLLGPTVILLSFGSSISKCHNVHDVLVP